MIANRKCNQKWLQTKNAIKNDCITGCLGIQSKRGDGHEKLCIFNDGY